MIVCVCRRISDRDIAHAAHGGCASFEDLQDELRVGVGCGACADCARKTFHAHVASADTAATVPSASCAAAEA